MTLLTINQKCARHNKQGSLLIPLTFFWLFLAVLFMQFTDTASLVRKKVKLQNAADTSAYTMALIQARALNSIAILNQGIELLKNSALVIYAVYGALIVASAFSGIAAAALRVYHRLAKPLMKMLRKLAKAMSEIQDLIIKYAPLLAIAEGERIAMANSAQFMFPYPLPPTPLTAKKDKMKLYVKRAKVGEKNIKNCRAQKISNFSRAMRAKQALTKQQMLLEEKWFYLDNNGKSIESDHSLWRPTGGHPPGLRFNYALLGGCPKAGSKMAKLLKFPQAVVLDSPFAAKQKVLALVKGAKGKIYTAAQAAPYGQDLFQDNWQVKLEKISLPRELPLLPLNKKILNEIDKWLLH